MKKTMMALTVTLMIVSPALAEEMKMNNQMMGHDMMQGTSMHQSKMSQSNDPRTSLNLSAPMRRHQLAMMREHLKAVDDIVAYIAQGKFDAASKIAHSKLGLTPEMKKMCAMLGKRNSDFRKTGLAFHKSADELGDTLKKGDLNQSLHALHTTMNYCIQCHATFRQ